MEAEQERQAKHVEFVLIQRQDEAFAKNVAEYEQQSDSVEQAQPAPQLRVHSQRNCHEHPQRKKQERKRRDNIWTTVSTSNRVRQDNGD